MALARRKRLEQKVRDAVCESHYHFLAVFGSEKVLFQNQKGVFLFRTLRFSAELSIFCKQIMCF